MLQSTKMLIDSHAHIYLEQFFEDRPAMLERAENEGIGKILMPAIDSITHQSMLDMESYFPGKCISMMGLHPCSVKEDYQKELSIVQSYLEKKAFVAIGEIGLDFYWDKTYTNQQYEAFHRQVEWALAYDIPIVIHSRNATDECIRVVAEYQKGNLKGVFHCFSGNADQAKQITDLGFYLGIGGVLTFKNSGLDKVMMEINLDRVVLETDAPYLAPVPIRGKRNEPSYLKYIVSKLAEIRDVSIKEVASITTANAESLFGEL